MSLKGALYTFRVPAPPPHKQTRHCRPPPHPPNTMTVAAFSNVEL